MGYIRAEEILSAEVIELIQQYVDGEHIYIPRKLSHRQAWGGGTQIKQELMMRNQQINQDYLAASKEKGQPTSYRLA